METQTTTRWRSIPQRPKVRIYVILSCWKFRPRTAGLRSTLICTDTVQNGVASCTAITSRWRSRWWRICCSRNWLASTLPTSISQVPVTVLLTYAMRVVNFIKHYELVALWLVWFWKLNKFLSFNVISLGGKLTVVLKWRVEKLSEGFSTNNLRRAWSCLNARDGHPYWWVGIHFCLIDICITCVEES